MTQIHIPRALIIDDSVDTGRLIQIALGTIPMIAFHETHGKAGMVRYMELHPAIVLLDINLPDMNGWEVLDAIKEPGRTKRRTGIIIITGHGDPANRLMGRLQGVDAFLIKPFSSDEVIQVVKKVLLNVQGKFAG